MILIPNVTSYTSALFWLVLHFQSRTEAQMVECLLCMKKARILTQNRVWLFFAKPSAFKIENHRSFGRDFKNLYTPCHDRFDTLKNPHTGIDFNVLQSSTLPDNVSIYKWNFQDWLGRKCYVCLMPAQNQIVCLVL